MSSFSIKILGIILMLIDHIGMFYPYNTPIWFRVLGRLVAPIFFYLIVEGYFHTKSKRKYFFRLLTFAMIMSFGNAIFNLIGIAKGSSILITPFKPNVLMSLATSVLILYGLDNFKKNKEKRAKYLLFIFGASLFMLLTEAGVLGIFMTIIFYFFKDKIYFIPLYIIASITIGYMTSGIIQSFMFLGIIPISLYNGKRGYDNIYIKYFFYIFYIIHIWILGISNI